MNAAIMEKLIESFNLLEHVVPINIDSFIFECPSGLMVSCHWDGDEYVVDTDDDDEDL